MTNTYIDVKQTGMKYEIVAFGNMKRIAELPQDYMNGVPVFWRAGSEEDTFYFKSGVCHTHPNEPGWDKAEGPVYDNVIKIGDQWNTDKFHKLIAVMRAAAGRLDGHHHKSDLHITNIPPMKRFTIGGVQE